MPTPILLTRPAETAEDFADALRKRLGPACEIVISPLIGIKLLNEDLSGIEARTAVFTSVNAVKAFARLDHRRDLRCYAVGPATAAAARAVGFDPITGKGNGAELANRILADQPPQPCLYLRGKHVAFDMAHALNAGGLTTYSRTLYLQADLPLSAEAQRLLSQPKDIILPLFSPRSASRIFEFGPFAAALNVVAISEGVALCVQREWAQRLIVAAQPNANAMLESIAGLWVAANQLEGRDPAQ